MTLDDFTFKFGMGFAGTTYYAYYQKELICRVNPPASEDQSKLLITLIIKQRYNFTIDKDQIDFKWNGTI